LIFYGTAEAREIHLGHPRQRPALCVRARQLPEELNYRPDPENPEEHGFLEPARRMSFEEYQQTIYGTRALWHRLRQDVR
jgi:hypothetical protein